MKRMRNSVLPPAGSERRIPAAPAAQVPPPSSRFVPARPAKSPEPPKAVAAGSGERTLIGRVISDKYGVNAVIGEGGMGAVYEAEHLTIGRLVAIKVLHPTNAKRSDAVQRFHHEARVAGSIGHPNICEIYDVGKLEDGSPYMVMERLHGEALAERVAREGALPWMDVIDIVVQVLSALVAAHGKGVIHRDIKPENIFLSARSGVAPVAKLLDFGISKVGNTDEDLHLTRTGMVMGTPYYMAPEQARGDRTIDHRIDLYATGAVLYECLSGRRPFSAPNYNALLVQILSGSPKPLREVRPALPPGFTPIVDKALAKNRESRFQSATEFLDALVTLREELVRAAARPTRSPPAHEAPAPPPSIPPADGSIEIPIHFTMSSAEYASVASGELMPAATPDPSVSDTDATSRPANAKSEERKTVSDVPPVPRTQQDASDTFVDSLASDDDDMSGEEAWQDRTEVVAPPSFGEGSRASFTTGNTPVLGVELAAVRRKLKAEPVERTAQAKPLDPREAEEIVAASREKKRALANNPLKPREVPPAPAAVPSKLSDRPPIPREDPAARKLPAVPRFPGAPRLPMGSKPDDDDAPTTFFRGRPNVATEELGDEDEIDEGPRHPTDPAPPPPPARPRPPLKKRLAHDSNSTRPLRSESGLRPGNRGAIVPRGTSRSCQLARKSRRNQARPTCPNRRFTGDLSPTGSSPLPASRAERSSAKRSPTARWRGTSLSPSSFTPRPSLHSVGSARWSSP